MAIQNLRDIIKSEYGTIETAANAMDMSKGNLSNLINHGDPDTLRPPTLDKLRKGFPTYNIEWILGRSPIKFKYDLSNYQDVHDSDRYIGIIDDYSVVKDGNAEYISAIDDKLDTKFKEISRGRYRMRVPLVDETAKAGYLMGFADTQYKEELPYHETIVDKLHRGNYMAFEISGDSMDNGTSDSILDGSIVTGRYIKPELWKSRLHSHQWPYWIVVTRTEGIVCKMIAKQDLDNGILTLRSLNLDKETFPDFDVHLDDIYQIFNIIKVERTF